MQKESRNSERSNVLWRQNRLACILTCKTHDAKLKVPPSSAVNKNDISESEMNAELEKGHDWRKFENENCIN